MSTVKVSRHLYTSTVFEMYKGDSGLFPVHLKTEGLSREYDTPQEKWQVNHGTKE